MLILEAKTIDVSRALFLISISVLWATPLAPQAWAAPPMPQAPTAPYGLILGAPAPTEVVLAWVDRSSNETSFRIERKIGAGGIYVEIGSTDANVTSYSDSIVLPNTQYYYRIRARNADGDSAYVSEDVITTPEIGTTPLRILSWNVQFNSGSDGVHDIDRTTQWIANINPDLAALCEAPSSELTTFVNMLETKTGLTWYSYHVGKTPGLDEGNVILSKYPLIRTSALYMSNGRSAAQAQVSVGGRNINFFATHLDSSAADDIRIQQTNELEAWAYTFAETRILAGDFNGDGPTEPHILDLVEENYDGWAEAINMNTAYAYVDNPVGSNTRTRRNRLDYVFYSAASSGLILRRAQIPDSRDLDNVNVVVTLGTTDDLGVRPSDHNHIIADFELARMVPF